MGRPRKNLNLNQANGNLNGIIASVEIAKPVSQTVDQIKQTNVVEKLNVAQGNLVDADAVAKILGTYKKDHYEKYKTIDDYSDALKQMSLAQLQKHSIEVANIVPMYDRNRLIQKLEYAFGEARAKKMPRTPMPNNLSMAQTKDVQAIIANRLNKKI